MVKITGWATSGEGCNAPARPGNAVKEVGAALFAGGSLIQVMPSTASPKEACGKGSRSFAPGEPPNADTHALDRQIETVQVRRCACRCSPMILSRSSWNMAPAAWKRGPTWGQPRPRNHAQVVLTSAQAVNRVIKRIS
jgi:hypothetical protein